VGEKRQHKTRIYALELAAAEMLIARGLEGEAETEAALVEVSEAGCSKCPRNSTKAAANARASDKNDTYTRPVEEREMMQEPSN
jgi:hypothetical protein